MLCGYTKSIYVLDQSAIMTVSTAINIILTLRKQFVILYPNISVQLIKYFLFNILYFIYNGDTFFWSKHFN